MITICQICQTEFVGRSNKKFCGERCRSLHNTRIYLEKNTALFDQEKIRRQNAKILKQIYTVFGENFFDQEILVRLGFDFRVTTFAVEKFSLVFGNFTLNSVEKTTFSIQKN